MEQLTNTKEKTKGDKKTKRKDTSPAVLKELIGLGLKEWQAVFLIALKAGATNEEAYYKARPKGKKDITRQYVSQIKCAIFKVKGVKEWYNSYIPGVKPKPIKVSEEAKKTSKQLVMSMEERREFLTKTIMESDRVSDRLKALDILNKMDAVYEKKTEVTGSIGVSVVWGEDDGTKDN